MRDLGQTLQNNKSILKTLGEVGASKQSFFEKLCQDGYPVYSYLRMSRSYSAPKTFTTYNTYYGYEDYAYHAIISYDKPFHTVIDNVLKAAGTYGISSFEDTFVAYGITDTTITGVSGNLVNALQMRFKEFFDINLNTSAYENLVRRLLRNTLTGGANYGYDASARDGGGPLLQQLHDMFAEDLINKGWTNSKIKALTSLS